MFRQLARERVLFQDRGVAPAGRTIELCHPRPVLLGFHAVDAIFVTVEGQQRAGAAHAVGFHRLEDDLGREGIVRMARRFVGGHQGGTL